MIKREVDVGDVIKERFHLESVLGTGGMSKVFRALDQRKVEAGSKSPYVAIKVLKVDGNEQSAFIGMQREHEKYSTLNHQNILRAVDFDRDGSLVYLTMELLEGETLDQLLKDRNGYGMEVEDARRIISQMAAALAEAHRQGIVHADFKPSNVFITHAQIVKVIDFGIARKMTLDGNADTNPLAVGSMTPSYASLEMFYGETPHPADDIYAFGCVVYKMLTGRHPYGDAQAIDVFKNSLPEPPRPTGLGDAQWRALSRTLEVKRANRTQSLREFLQGFFELGHSNSTVVLPQSTTSHPRRRISYVVLGSFFVTALLGLLVTYGKFELVQRMCSACPEMTRIEAGSEVLGLPVSAAFGSLGENGMFEHPQQTVVIEQPFDLGAMEVTVGQFRTFAEENTKDRSGCSTPDSNWKPVAELLWSDPGFPQSNEHPVTCISWNDAMEYVSWLSRKTERKYRLPSEMEWEYAARKSTNLPVMVAVTDDATCRTSNIADKSTSTVYNGIRIVDCSDDFIYTAPVNRRMNDGLADMRGNVFEWTQDCWNESYNGSPRDGSPRLSGNCRERVLRGGSWFTAPEELRLTFRNRADVNQRASTFGFRVVVENES